MPDTKPKTKRQKIVRYVNIYDAIPAGEWSTVSFFLTKEHANHWAGDDRIACKRVEIEFGPGEFDA